MSVRDFEKGTKLVIQAKDKLHEQEYRHIILGMIGLIQGEHQIHGTKHGSGHTDAWCFPTNATTASTTSAATFISIPLDPFESPRMASANLLKEVIPDIWQGLEQLDICVNKSSALQQPAEASQARAESNEFVKEARANFAGIGQPFVAVEGRSSEPVSLPITPTEGILDSNISSSGAFYLPPTRDISTIQTLPSAVVPPRCIPTISAIEPYIPSAGLQGTTEEQQLQQKWQSTHAQWSSTRQKSKYADVKATYISGPRRSDDVRMHELRVDSSGELKGGLSSSAIEKRNKENHGTNNPGQPRSKGSGKGAFRNLSGRRAGGCDRTIDRGRIAERGGNGVEQYHGRGYGTYSTRGRSGRQGRGGNGTTVYLAGTGGNGW